MNRICKSKQIETGGLTSRHLSYGIVPMPDETRETGADMTDLMMTEYRHAKIAELLAIMWACNAADSDNPPTWTRPAMAGTVCNPLMKAVRGLLNADFYIYDDVDQLTEEVITMLIDDNAQFNYQVTSAVNFVISDNRLSQ